MADHLKIDSSTLLRDDELVLHLKAGHTLVYRGLGKEWQQVERQIERLGFGEAYLVSQLEVRESSIKVSPNPRYQANSLR